MKVIPPSSTLLPEFLENEGYRRFLKTSFLRETYLPFLGNERLLHAGRQVGIGTFRDSWKSYYQSSPVFCGKAHEYTPGLDPNNCKKKGNPLCGHLDDTPVFHTVSIACYVAGVLSGDSFDPNKLLRLQEKLDARISGLSEVIRFFPRGIPVFAAYARTSEEIIWEKIHPVRQELQRIMADKNYI